MNNPQPDISNYSSSKDEDEIDLAKYFHIISAHKWSIIGFSLFVTLLTIFYVSSLDSIYESTLTLLIESEEENVVSIDEVYGIPDAIYLYFETQNQILQSRNLAEKVIDELNLSRHADFDPALQKPGMVQTIFSWLPVGTSTDEAKSVPEYVTRNGIVAKFKNSLKVKPVYNSQLIDITFESKDPLMGPFFSLMVPMDVVLEARAGNLIFRIKGGGFAFYNFDNRINYGNLDRVIANHEGWDVVNADFTFDNGLGYGYRFGAEMVVYITNQFGINVEVNYYVGGSPVKFRGAYTGGSFNDQLSVVEVDYPDSKLDFTGFELTLGVLIRSK